MRRMSIKLKITLWFTAFMILISVICFTFIATVSSATSTSRQKDTLTALIDGNAGEIEYDEGEIDIDDDFVTYKSGIYCLVYTENGDKIIGSAPDEFDGGAFKDNEVRYVGEGEDRYVVYDRLLTFNGHESVWIRGIALESSSIWASSSVTIAIVFALPLLIILASIGGYLIARRSLKPIQSISRTAGEIGSSGDLSKRIHATGNDELGQLSDVFNQMFEKLESNFEAERHFTSDASHELRTPVTTILAQCEYAFENASGEQELYEALEAIQKQGYRMSHLIEALLRFTRMEQNVETLTRKPVDLSSLALTVCSEQSDIGEKNIKLRTQIEPNIIFNGDTPLLAQMMSNLIKNAYRYGKENGNITASLRRDNRNIVFSVKDDGIGIAREELPKIWNRFYRVDNARTNVSKSGFGLGLAFVKQIAELHGGSIRVDSTPDYGSTFTVIF